MDVNTLEAVLDNATVLVESSMELEEDSLTETPEDGKTVTTEPSVIPSEVPSRTASASLTLPTLPEETELTAKLLPGNATVDSVLP